MGHCRSGKVQKLGSDVLARCRVLRVCIRRIEAIEPEERVELDWALPGEQEREGDFVNLRQQKRPRKKFREGAVGTADRKIPDTLLLRLSQNWKQP